jgi:catechol 2,3-dioxygenase-like lactoylglutathione lyase family enzyme
MEERALPDAMPSYPHSMTPIVPCHDLEASVRFYARLGFRELHPTEAHRAEYRVLEDGEGGEVHLALVEPGWVIPGRNPFGVYLTSRRLPEIAKAFDRTPHETDYGMLEIALSDPDETLVRIGWPMPAKRAPKARRPAPRRAARAKPKAPPPTRAAAKGAKRKGRW